LIDESIIEKAKYGDKQAFRSIFHFYEQKVFSTAYFIMKDRQHAEDVVQEAFLKVYLKVHKLENNKVFEIWLYKITVNACSSFFRKLNKFNTTSIDENIMVEEFPIGGKFSLPDNILIRKEFQEKVMEVVYALPVKHRTVITLYYYNNMSIKEISNIVGCSEGTVKSRLFYGKKELKKALDLEEEDKEDAIYEF
jgi:RNA polymerase sigma-70 factor (ECF subfamily)